MTNRLPAQELPGWLAAMLPEGVTRYRIDVGGREMAVMEVGEGRPVLLVHGNPTWGFLYRKVASELLGGGLRLIMPDLLGLGFSDRIGSAEHTLANHRRWLATAIDELQLERLVLVIQDWGGPIGLLAAHDSAATIDGMVVMNTVVGPPKKGFKPTLFHRVSRWPIVSDLLFRGIGFPQAGMHLAQGDKSSIRGQVARAYRYPLRNRLHNQAPLALARMVPNTLEHESVPELRRCHEAWMDFAGPVALVWGTNDPVLGGVLPRMLREKPLARVTKTEAGHFLQEEVPGSIADAIRWVVAESAQD